MNTNTLLLVLALSPACRSDKSGDDSGSLTPGGGDDTATDDDTAGTDDTAPADDTGESGWMKSNCEYEAPPTPFTGGLVYLAYTFPFGGEYTIPFDDRVVTDVTGVVDWDAGTLASETHHVDDSTTVLVEISSTFDLANTGDYTADTVTTMTMLDGSSNTNQASITKTGCVTVTVSINPDNGETATTVSTLVSADRIESTMSVENDEGDDVTYSSVGVSTSDWTTEYSFQTDSADTEVDPDREGTCTYTADGTASCDMTMYYDSGARQESSSVWEYDGDWQSEWYRYDDPESEDATTWGIRSGDYWGAGEATWWTAQSDGSVVECSGEWDADGIGTWSCDDGSSGTYP